MTREELFAHERRRVAMAPTGCNTGCLACGLLSVLIIGAVALGIWRLIRG